MTAIIVEDELASREMLKKLLKKHFPNIQIEATARTAAEAIPLIQKHQPELVFLDIELPNEDGFELLNNFDPIPFKIIFITAFERYASRVFRIPAVDYLLKPIELNELKEAISKAQNSKGVQQKSQLNHFRNNYRSHPPKLSLLMKEGHLFVKMEDIIRCKAEGRYTQFFISDGSKHLITKNIGAFEDILCNYEFLRVHRSQIINLNKIKMYLKGKPAEVVMEDNAKVLVSKAQRDNLLDHLGLS